MRTDAFANAAGRLTGKGATPPAEQLVVGGVEFGLPAAWGRLGATAASASHTERIGTIVSALCPAGGAGSACVDGTQVTFIAYSGKAGHALPVLNVFEGQLDAKLTREFSGFVKGETKMRPGADGIRYLDYSFTWTQGRAVHHQRFAVYRHGDGSGVVAIATGARLQAHAKAISEFLATAHDPASSE
ncbi:MAG: hypothetical protein JWM98_2808 [Thermoleophilia bacterium]|nr:hypothetical protein [Thermoleophilia bacterium]